MKTLLMTFFSDGQKELTVTKSSFTWTSSTKKIALEVKNTDNKDMGPFTIYFDAEGRTVSGIPQINQNVKGLKRGASVNVTADFTTLEDHNLKKWIK